jgi:hypothetical protein
MKQITQFILKHNILAFIIVVMILFVAADRGDFFHINLKGDLLGKNTALKQYPILMQNEDGTYYFRADSAGNLVITGAITADNVTLLLADSTAWNLAVTRAALLVADSTAWNTAATRAGLLVADSTAWNLAVTRAALYVADSAKQITDSAAFSGSETRVAVYVAGVTPSSKFLATPRIDYVGAGETIPVVGDLIGVAHTTDSLIFLRDAGTTSGLKFTYRGKK